MYNDIGKKIKYLAILNAVAGTVGSLIGGILIINSAYGMIPLFDSSSMGDTISIAGWLVIIGGSILSWISSWLLYGFGELIERTVHNEENTRKLYQAFINKNNLPTVNNQAKPAASVEKNSDAADGEKHSEPAYSELDSIKRVGPTFSNGDNVIVCGEKYVYVARLGIMRSLDNEKKFIYKDKCYEAESGRNYYNPQLDICFDYKFRVYRQNPIEYIELG